MGALRNALVNKKKEPATFKVADMVDEQNKLRPEYIGRRFSIPNYQTAKAITGYGTVNPITGVLVVTEMIKTDARRVSPVTGHKTGYCVYQVRGVDDMTRNPAYYMVGDDAIFEEAEPLTAEDEAARELLGVWNYRYSNAIGADPELFVVDKNGELIPAFEFAGPKSASSVGKPYWDGYQVEYNTSVHTCLSYHTDAVQLGIANTLKAARDRFPGARLSTRNVFEIPPDRLMNDDRKYVMFGCNPSLSVYDEVFPEVDPTTVPFRSAGGHLHFSFDNKHLIPTAIKELDRVLAVICVSLFQHYDEPRRRMMYGRAGEYRLTKYGFEYRPLSNAWLIHPLMAMLVYEVARRVLGQVNSGKTVTAWKADEAEVRQAINNCDVELAQSILKRNEKVLIALFSKFYNVNAKRLGQIVFDGLHTALENPEEFSPRWFEGWRGHSEAENCSLYKTNWSAKFI